MKLPVLRLLILIITCFAVTSSCSQKKTAGPLADTYIGSTPCDSLIVSLLQIPATQKNDFIKWELNLQKNTTDTFRIEVRHGESKPNTNDFIDGGTKLILTGKYTVSHGTNENFNAKVYSLKADQLKSPFVLVEMDNNILHFADTSRKLIVGNGGWGYVLNRVTQ